MNLKEYFSTFPELKILYNRVKAEYEQKKPIHHNWTHVLRDTGKVIHLGEIEQARMKIVIAGILLHDIGRLHPEAEGKQHFEIGAEVAPRYLKDAGFTEEEITAVIQCVLSNGPRGTVPPRTLEAQICYDVDFSCTAGYVGVGRAFHHFMAEENMNFWQDHSLRFLEMAFCADRRERLEHPDGYGKRTGGCGDTVEMFLSLLQGRIQSICFMTDGCSNTNACANTVARMAETRTLDEAWEITPEQVISYLETLPLEKTHCAELAVGALYLALADARRHPFK